jgi:hypothetical protein
MAMCGHRWGLLITATTATPEAVLTGFCLRNGNNLGLYSIGMAAKMSVIRGTPGNLYLRAACDLSEVKLSEEEES